MRTASIKTAHLKIDGKVTSDDSNYSRNDRELNIFSDDVVLLIISHTVFSFGIFRAFTNEYHSSV